MRLLSLSEVSIQPRTSLSKFLKNKGVRMGVSGGMIRRRRRRRIRMIQRVLGTAFAATGRCLPSSRSASGRGAIAATRMRAGFAVSLWTALVGATSRRTAAAPAVPRFHIQQLLEGTRKTLLSSLT